MKTKLLRWGLALLCLIAMIFTMAACNNNNDNNETDNQTYTASFFDIPESVTDISRLLISNDTAYLCCSEVDDNNETISYLAAVTLEGGDLQKLSLDIDTSIRLLDFGIDQNGSIWAVCSDSTGGHSLEKFDSKGTALQSVDLSPVLDAIASSVDSELFLSIDSDGNICIALKSANTYACLFDNQGQFLFDLNYEGNLLTTATTAEGRIGVCSSTTDRQNYNLLTVDVDNKGWHKDKMDLGTAAGLYGGSTSSFYLFDSSNLYGYSSGSEEQKLIFSWSDVGLSTSDVHLCELSDGRFVVLAASANQASVRSYELAVLSQGSDERIALSMVSLSARPSVMQAVSDFNKRNSEYRIELTEYFPYEENVSDEDWDNAVLSLNTQIISGDIPDILDMSDLPVEIYYNKELLENLYPYIGNDPEINMKDYYENVFDAISIDGELPFVTNGVSVYTMAADSGVVGDNPGWTLNDLESLLETSGAASIGNLTSEWFLKTMLQTSDSFVDWSSGECNFNSPEMIELLETAKKIQEGSGGNFSGTASESYVASYEAVFTAYKIAQVRNSYQGNLNMIGLPNDSGEYHALDPEVKIGMSSGSKYKDGAWSFVRTFLTEDQQESCDLLPIHKGAFATVMQAAIDGKSVWTILNEYENIKVTEEDVKIIESLLNSASYTVNDNQTLEAIVLEEAQEFFSGDKTAQESAEKIQSRASNYVNEQK